MWNKAKKIFKHEGIDREHQRLNVLHLLQSAIVSLSPNVKAMLPFVGIMIGLVIFVFTSLLIHHQTRVVSTLTVHETQKSKIILNQLADMNAALQQLSTSPQNSSGFKQALQNMSADLSTIKQTVIAEQSDVEKLQAEVTQMKAEMNTQMASLQKTVSQSNNAKQYLDASQLPFHVISIDVISGQPFISVDYAHHVSPLEVGDSLAGWHVSSCDYDAGTVEFKNSQGQYIKVVLQG